jgi:hypothetical protein
VVSSGFIHGNSVDSGEGSYLNWQVATQDTPNNRSLINWQFGWLFSTTSCRGLRKGSCSISGNILYNNQTGGDGVHTFGSGHDHRPAYQVASGSLWIGHNNDGTAGIYAGCDLTGFSGLRSNGSGVWSLPTINRLSDPPSTPVFGDIRQTSFVTAFLDGGNGAPIDSREAAYTTDPGGSGLTIVAASSIGYATVTGLSPGTTYYVWARTHNAAGYSGWSGRGVVRTIAGTRVNDGGTWKEAIPYVRVGGVWKLARPWVRTLGEWKETI